MSVVWAPRLGQVSEVGTVYGTEILIRIISEVPPHVEMGRLEETQVAYFHTPWSVRLWENPSQLCSCEIGCVKDMAC